MTESKALTPAQKAAKTRAANKAAKEAALETPQLAVIEPLFAVPELQPAVLDVANMIEEAGDSKFIQRTISRVTPKFSSRVRDFIYSAGIVLGVIGAIAGAIQSFLSGDAAYVAASIGAISLALTNALAKLNLSKAASDFGQPTAV